MNTLLDNAIVAHVRALPRSNDAATYADLSKALKVSVQQVRDAVKRLVAQKKVAVLAWHRRARLRNPGVPGASGHRYVTHLVYIPRELR